MYIVVLIALGKSSFVTISFIQWLLNSWPFSPLPFTKFLYFTDFEILPKRALSLSPYHACRNGFYWNKSNLKFTRLFTQNPWNQYFNVYWVHVLFKHHITLGFEFQQDMAPPLNSEICTFIDFNPVIRILGEETWLEMLNVQKAETIGFVCAPEYHFWDGW